VALATNYAGWIQLIRDFLDLVGPDITDEQIGWSLQLGQAELNKSLNSWRMEKEEVLTATVDGDPIDMSGIPDFNRVQLITGGTYGKNLRALAFNELINMNAAIASGDASTDTQEFHYYAIQGQKLYTVPMPAAGDVFKVFYYQLVPSLSEAPPVDTNIFSEYHSEALLYTSLVAASQFISEDERTSTWATLATNAVNTINEASKGSKMGSTPLVRQFSVYGSGNNGYPNIGA